MSCRALRPIENRPLNIAQVDRMLAAAARQATLRLSTITHLIPCHLIGASDPTRIVIGPITFHNRNSIRAVLLQSCGRRCASRNEDDFLHRRLLAKAIRYYRNFRWVAEVTISGCDPGTSADVAENAVTAALDCIHMLFGFERTDRTHVGGVGIRVDRRAKLTISDSGVLQPSLSTSQLGHVEYEQGWSQVLEKNEGFQWWTDMCGVALESAVDPTLNRPLSRRFLDAIQWFGEGCREKSASTRTVKFMTSVERLLTTGEHDDISKMIANRTANLCFYPDDTREHWREKTKRAYNYRSRLVHGSMAPRDDETRHGAHLAAEVAQAVLRRALESFDTSGLRAEDMTQRRLAKWFEQLQTWAERTEQSWSQTNHPSGTRI